MQHNCPLIVALDLPPPEAMALVARLEPARCALKVGMGLFMRGGPELVEQLVRSGHRVFLDLKLHDIPSVNAEACRVAAALGVWMVNVHAAAGAAALALARDTLEQYTPRPLLVAVTVLTSTAAVPGVVLEDEVHSLAVQAEQQGADGVVCSAREARQLRGALGRDFCLVTPGIRLTPEVHDDQQRTATPRQAITAGADYLVIGRPIVRAAEPLAVLGRIEDEIRQARAGGTA